LRSQHVLPTLRLAIAGADQRAPERFRIIQYSVQYDHIHLLVEAIDQQALSSGMSSVAIRIARSVNALVGRRGRFWADRWHGHTLTSPRQVRTALVYVLANFRKHSRRRLGPGIDPFSSGAWFDGWQGGPLVATGSVMFTGAGKPRPGAERAPPGREFIHDGIRNCVRDAMHDTERDAMQARDAAHDAEREAMQERDALCADLRQPAHGASPRCVPEAPPVSRPRTWLARAGWRRYGLLRLDESPAGAPRTA
jgi:REP element-mobilizing transposase RayT